MWRWYDEEMCQTVFRSVALCVRNVGMTGVLGGLSAGFTFSRLPPQSTREAYRTMGDFKVWASAIATATAKH